MLKLERALTHPVVYRRILSVYGWGERPREPSQVKESQAKSRLVKPPQKYPKYLDGN